MAKKAADSLIWVCHFHQSSGSYSSVNHISSNTAYSDHIKGSKLCKSGSTSLDRGPVLQIKQSVIHLLLLWVHWEHATVNRTGCSQQQELLPCKAAIHLKASVFNITFKSIRHEKGSHKRTWQCWIDDNDADVGNNWGALVSVVIAKETFMIEGEADGRGSKRKTKCFVFLTQSRNFNLRSLEGGGGGTHWRCVSDSVIEPGEIKAKPCNAPWHAAHIKSREKKSQKCSSDKKAMFSVKY